MGLPIILKIATLAIALAFFVVLFGVKEPKPDALAAEAA
jgi:hypothetical protein